MFGDRLNDVTMTSLPIRFLWNINTNQPRVYLSNILNFILINHKRAEIQGSEVNRELWSKIGYYVIVTLTFDPRSPNSIGFEPVQEATILRKSRPNRCIRSAGILFTRNAGHTDTQTNWSENITPPRFRGGVKIKYLHDRFRVFGCKNVAVGQL